MVDEYDNKTKDMFEEEFLKEYNAIFTADDVFEEEFLKEYNEIFRESSSNTDSKSEADEYSGTERPLGFPRTDG